MKRKNAKSFGKALWVVAMIFYGSAATADSTASASVEADVSKLKQELVKSCFNSQQLESVEKILCGEFVDHIFNTDSYREFIKEGGHDQVDSLTEAMGKFDAFMAGVKNLAETGKHIAADPMEFLRGSWMRTLILAVAFLLVAAVGKFAVIVATLFGLILAVVGAVGMISEFNSNDEPFSMSEFFLEESTSAPAQTDTEAVPLP